MRKINKTGRLFSNFKKSGGVKILKNMASGSNDARFTEAEEKAIEEALKKRLGPNFISHRPAMGGSKVCKI